MRIAGWYCTACEVFAPDRDPVTIMREDGRCSHCGGDTVHFSLLIVNVQIHGTDLTPKERKTHHG